MALTNSEWYILTINEVGNDLLCLIIESDNTHTHLRIYPNSDIKLFLTGDIISGNMIKESDTTQIKKHIDQQLAQQDVEQRIIKKYQDKAQKEIEKQKPIA